MVKTRKKKEKTPEVEDLKSDEESSSNEVTKEREKPDDSSAQESDFNKETSAADSSQPTTEDEAKSGDSKPTLRLVPLNLLLKPEIVNPPKKSSRKARNAKKSSYIEVSSEESDQEKVSVASSSESSDISDDPLSKKKRKSTKGKLTNGKSSEIFKEPLSPTKITKSSKNLSVNVNKMPQNVNKLMKSYRVESKTSLHSWSESDDFENMIETSKIDRSAPEKVKSPPKETSDEGSTSQAPVPQQKKRGPKAKVEKAGPKKSKKVELSSSDEIGPTRSRSTRNAAVNRKKILDIPTSSSEDSEIDEDKPPPPAKIKTPRGGRKQSEPDKNTSTVEEDSKEEESDSKKQPVDDHGNHKNSKRQQDTSSEDEGDNEPLAKTTRSSRNRDVRPSAKKSKSDDNKTTDKRKSSPRGKDKSNSLKITINLNKSEIINHDEDCVSSTSDSSDKKEVEDTSSKDDSSSSEFEVKKKHKVVEEIPEEEKLPICDQKLRSRQKFETNKDFNKLKELIRERKSKSGSSVEVLDVAKESKKKNEGKENHQTNGGEQESMDMESSDHDSAKKSAISSRPSEKSAKRKRVISSSDEEDKSHKKDEPLEKKIKKAKMESSDSEFEENSKMEENEENEESESESKKSESEQSSSNDDDDDDDDDEDIGKKKRALKKKKTSDSEDLELDELEKDRVKIKRKRIKKMASSEEENADDDEDGDGKKASGRKTIRKIMRTDKLDVSTKEAAKIERERKQRIEDRQQMYNQFYDERPEEAKEITKLVLDFDEETKEPLLEVDKKLCKKLKPHQANGVKFMWDACFESIERAQSENGSGCILAHCMGLGKTLQVVTLTHTLIMNSENTNVTRVLVVCPLNTVLNWVNEFNIWLKDLKGFEDFYIYEINKLKQNVDRANKLMEWHNDGGVMIMSYDMFRNLTNENNKSIRKKIRESLKTSLVDPGPDLVICDEGHLLKNEKTSISKAMMKLRSLRRIVLTGTPLQNNLKEYYCMVQFVKPNLLGKYTEYLNRFVNPITNGQYTDSSEYDILLMRRRAHVLHKMLDGCVQRRDYSVLTPFLPPKHEYVISIKLTPMQTNLYKYYMENKARQGDGGRKGSILFQDFQNLQRIWTAPKVLRYNSDRYEIEMQKRKDLESEDESIGSIKDFIDDSESAVSTSSGESLDSSSDDCEILGSDVEGSIHSDEEKKKKKKKKKKEKAEPVRRKTRAMAVDCPSDHELDELIAASKAENPTEWWMQICAEEELNNIEHSSKLMLLFSILEKCEQIGDKLLVFSQSLYSLDVIEHFLNYVDEQTQQNATDTTFQGSWTLGQDYFRLDGSTPVEQRNASCKIFNDSKNTRARLFLISTRAGGLGINLVAANRVIIFDVSWNPSHDIQSIFRVYRFGQIKPCYIYRFLAMGTMEEKIYERQVTKQAISKRVIDEQQIDRHYNQNDLQELYKYDVEPDDERILPLVPKDRLFAEMIKKYEDVIYKYHEHDSLLENKEEETLNEAERKAAWDEFESEKNRPQYPTFYSQAPMSGQQPQHRMGPVTSNNIFGIRTDVLLKLLSLKAQLDNPSISEFGMKQSIPLLMQELYRQMDRGELTLYQQLIALSGSLEVPPAYGGHFNVNKQRLQQAYNSFSASPSTSSSLLARQALADRHRQLRENLQNSTMKRDRPRSPPRIIPGVVEID